MPPLEYRTRPLLTWRCAFTVCFYLLGFLQAGYGQSDQVTQLIAALKTWSMLERSHVVDVLVSIGTPAIDPLMAALQDKDTRVRGGAAEALGKIESKIRDPSPFVIEALITTLNGDVEVQNGAARALSDIGAPTIGPLITALQSRDDPEIREGAAVTLDLMRGHLNDAAIQALIGALRDRSVGVRMSAAKTLANTQDPRAVEPLIAILNDPNLRTSRAAEALGKYRDARAVEPLIAALKDKSGFTRASAAEALGKIRDPRAIEPLIAVLVDHPCDALGEDCINAAAALSEFKVFNEPRMLVELTDAVRQLMVNLKDPSKRTYYVAILKKVPAFAIDPLLTALKDPDTELRVGAALAIQERTESRVINALLEAWKSRDLAVVAGAPAFFVRRGEPGSEDILIQALNAFGDETTATAMVFLNCGNSKLSAAASRWAYARHLQTIRLTGAGDNVRWGGAGR